MNYRKTDPVGIDKVIDRIQSKIYDPLLSKWGSLDIYGRVYKKTDKNGSISLERYVGDGEYEKVLFSEGNKIFFVQGNSPKINFRQGQNDLWAVCIIELSESTKRNDEEAHLDLTTEIGKVLGMESLEGLEYGMTNLKKVVEEPFQNSHFKYTDIHPYHVFMLKTNVTYLIINNEC